MSIQRVIKCVLIALMVTISSAVLSAGKTGIYYNRYDLHMVDASKNVYLVSAQIEFNLSSYLEQALLNGVVLEANTLIGLGKRRDWWWNDTGNLSIIKYQIKYHALSRHFLLTRNDTNENWNYRSLSGALRQMGSIVNYKLPALPRRVNNGRYYLFMRTRLSPATLRLPLRIQSLFSNQYSVASEVVSWPLK